MPVLNIIGHVQNIKYHVPSFVSSNPPQANTALKRDSEVVVVVLLLLVLLVLVLVLLLLLLLLLLSIIIHTKSDNHWN